MEMFVWCKFRVTGFHNWPDAPLSVEYLREKHRHEFHFYVAVEVREDNRQIEFITLKEACRFILFKLWHTDLSNNFLFENRSCEMIAKELLSELEKVPLYNNFNLETQIIVEVSEDGENGATVFRLS